MQNEALTTEVKKLQQAVNIFIEDESGDLDMILCKINNVINPGN